MYYTIVELKGAVRVFNSAKDDRGRLTFECLKLSVGYEDTVPIARAVQASSNFRQQFSNAFYLKQDDPLVPALKENQQTIVGFEKASPSFIDVARFASMLFPEASEISLSNNTDILWRSALPISGLSASEEPVPASPK